MDKLYRQSQYQSTVFTLFDSSFHSEILPKKPYCTDNLQKGIYPRTQRIAITKRYIQLNPPEMQYWLVFDIDRPNSAFAWYDANLPAPFAVVVNEENTHCHIVYALASPVCTSDFAHQKPLRYLAAIQRAYTEKLKADFNYSGLIAKNPFSQNHWRVIPVAVEARYELSYLEQWVAISNGLNRNLRASEAVALGRNCAMFYSLRKYSYKAIKQYRSGKVDIWRNHILDQAMSMNVFNEPLPHSEIKAIAKSVANWVWKHMRQDTEEFKHRQSIRGRKGGISKGKANHNKRVAAQVLRAEGYSQKEIAQALAVGQSTVCAWLKDFNELFQSTD
jgi:hypothetical protein